MTRNFSLVFFKNFVKKWRPKNSNIFGLNVLQKSSWLIQALETLHPDRQDCVLFKKSNFRIEANGQVHYFYGFISDFQPKKCQPKLEFLRIQTVTISSQSLYVQKSSSSTTFINDFFRKNAYFLRYLRSFFGKNFETELQLSPTLLWNLINP